jgi:hypothetical protein
MEVSSPEVGANVGDLFSSYESRTRQHKMLNIKALRPSDYYFPSDITNHEGHILMIMIKNREHSYNVQKIT